MKLWAILAVCCPVLAFGAALAESPEVQSTGQSQSALQLSLGIAQDVNLSEDFDNVQIGDPSIADINIIDKQLVTIVPKNVGVTNVVFYDRKRGTSVSYLVSVSVAQNMSLWVGGKKFPYLCSGGRCEPVDTRASGKDPFDMVSPTQVTEKKITTE